MSIRSIRVSHIVLSTKDVADLLLENLQSCESNELMLKMFSKLAKKYSACGTSKKGGDLGFMDFNTSAPELEKAAMQAPVGKVSGPIQSKFGYHILRLDKIIPSKLIPFSETKTDIMNLLLKKETQKLFTSYVEDLGNNAKIEVFL